MTSEIPQHERCTVQDCANKWGNLCRICALQVCLEHTLLVKEGGIPGGHWRCPTCAVLPREEALVIWRSSEAQHRREAFAGRMLLLLREHVDSERWNWMMEQAELLGVNTEQFRASMRTAIGETTRHMSEPDEGTSR
jgi:hypothetical protein